MRASCLTVIRCWNRRRGACTAEYRLDLRVAVLEAGELNPCDLQYDRIQFVDANQITGPAVDREPSGSKLAIPVRDL